MNPYNIFSGIMARRLTDLTTETNYASDSVGPYTYSLRHCTVHGERSGGAEVKVTLDREFEHGTYFCNRSITRRLKRGFSMRSLINAIGRCRNEIEAKHVLRVRREKLYKAMNAVEDETITHEDVILMAEVAVRAGFSDSYTDMQEKDIDYWSGIVRQRVAALN